MITINEDSFITKVLPSRKAEPDSPGQLASELAEAQREFQAKRNDVIDRGVQRSQALAALIAEAQEEQAGVESVIDAAKKA